MFHLPNVETCVNCKMQVSQKHSHNGLPLFEGRVCNKCNSEKVVPYRFLMMMMERENSD